MVLKADDMQYASILGDLGIRSLDVYLRRGGSRNGWLAFKDNDTISEICCHDEIVLNNEGGPLSV